MLNILALPGSLRAGSTSAALLRQAADVAPEGLKVTLGSIDLPLYNQDLDVAPGPPQVAALKRAIDEADGLLIATPEYNYSVPGPLKNAIDWASRPAYQSVLAHKPVGVLGTSHGASGSARAQGHLKQILLGTISEVFPHPEFLLPGAHSAFEDGQLRDEDTRAALGRYMTRFAEWLSRSPGR